MLTHQENELLCRIGPGTPMGAMMRRYWLPILTSSELEADGDPRRVRLLGEDLVAFRDNQGRIGLLDELCPHRRASLALGRNENGALECLYHGWRIECTGRILDTPVEPEDSTFKDRIRATAYATCEAGGVIWAYMGPAEHKPPEPDFHFTQVDPKYVMIVRGQENINWAQGVEGVIDSAHTNFLHMDGVRPSAGVTTTVQGEGYAERPSRDTRPRFETEDTEYGFRYAAIRKPIVDADKQKYVRTTLFMAPVYAMFPPPQDWIWMQAFTPLDDEHTMFWFFQVSNKPIGDEQREKMLEKSRMRPGIDLDDQLRPLGNRDNGWLQDRAAMRRGETHTGIAGINREDIAVQESMRPVLDRTEEHLGVSDTAVIHFRRLMLDAVRKFQNGAPPPGRQRELAYKDLRTTEEMVPLNDDWRVSRGGFVT
ncbi:MAG TPA: Rieske 2Fe-2S domain-containing protein, partial [Paraburkholderia sp.]